MIAYLSEKLSLFFVAKGIIPDEDNEVFKYIFEMFISTFVGLFTVALISFLTGMHFYALLFMLGFIPLRLIAGGYHAKNHFRCFSVFLFTFSTVLLLVKYTPLEYLYLITSLCMISSLLLVFLFAPSADNNKPINDIEKVKFKKKSRLVIIGYLFLVLLLILLISDTKLVFSLVLGNFTVAISLLANYMKVNRPAKLFLQKGGNISEQIKET